MQDKITHALSEQSPQTIADLMEATGASETTVRKHLKAMIDDGRLVVTKVGRTATYALPTSEPAPDPANEDKEPAPSKSKVRLESLARDELVLRLLEGAGAEGVNVHEIAEVADTTTGKAYSAIWRIKKTGVIEKFRDGTRVPRYRMAKEA